MDGSSPEFSRVGLRMRRAYVFALGLVGVLSLGAFALLDGFIAQQGDSASVINVAGRQRMLSQRIAGLAESFAQQPAGPSRERDRALLERAVEEMASAHEGLMRGDAERNLPGIQSAAERAHYTEPPHEVDVRLRRYLADARALLGATDRETQRALSRRMGDLARTDLLGALNAVVVFHEIEAREDASRAEALHLGLLVSTLLILVFEARFVFAPLVRELISAERSAHERQVELTYQSWHDQLTGLHNRHRLKRLADEVQAADVEKSLGYALIAIDLDNFKNVNDTQGHEAGDRLLRLVATHLGGAVRGDDLAFRIGGDEFLVVLRDADLEFASEVAERLRVEIRASLASEPGCDSVSATLGVAAAPLHGATVDEVLANADIALYHAKSLGKDAVAVFRESLRASFDERRATEALIRRALAEDGFEPHFQPQFDMRTGRVVGVEALARCRDADGTIVPPSAFLAVAEDSGTVVAVGERIVDRAVRVASGWLAEGMDFGRLSVNASPAQLRDRGFVDFLESTLARYDFPAARLSVEILETVLVDDDDDAVVSIVDRIRALGIAVELDDFGTGHTSIANVDRLKVDRIKIDRSLVTPLGVNDSRRQVLKAIITMADALGVGLIAEGIETEVQERILIELGCSAGQGYRFARPMDAERAGALLAHRSGGPVALRRAG